jgi:LacI family transcriptional regulator
MPGIVDVARKAGVSITTVSRTFNPVTEYPVAPATRQRVLAAAAALQYSPSALARALVTRRSRIVGVLVGDIVDPYFAEIVRGIEDVARRAGYLVIVCNTSRDPGTERRYISALRDYRADAILFIGGDFFDAAGRRALERDMALVARHGTVAVGVAGDRVGLPAFDIDHTAAAEEMTRYLVGLGHREIGFVGGSPGVQTARERLAGFRKGLAAAELREAVVEDADFTYAGGQAAAQRMLEGQRLTAIFAANDQMALGTLAACRRAGVEVPGEVTVVGFGNTAAAEHAVPALSTVAMPRHQLGVEAMQAVLDALALESTTVRGRRLPFYLVIRESSAPPPTARRKGRRATASPPRRGTDRVRN